MLRSGFIHQAIAMPPTTQPVIHVCIPRTRRDYFDYAGEEAVIGGRVWVPFGQKRRMGVVVGFGELTNPTFTIRPIIEAIDAVPMLPPHLLHLCQWVSQYYQAPLSEVLSLALPKQLREGAGDEFGTLGYQLMGLPDEAHAALHKRATRCHRLIDVLAEHPALPQSTLTQLGFTTQHLKTLIEKNLIKTIPWVDALSHEVSSSPLTLHPEQAEMVALMTQSLSAYRCFLVDGVTGSGKTEVYLQVIAQVLAEGKQALVLVPEIGLTPQLLSRFRARFSVPMEVVHSHLNDTERRRAWQHAKQSIAKLVIGTRGAVFTPMPDLGLIVIDEEHDASFKQMDRVRYSARDTALMRAYMADIPIILGSATPSLESLHNGGCGKYTLLRLTQKAVSRRPLRYQILDIRNEPLKEGIASQTLPIIREHLDRQHQVLVFINRRGYSPVLLCHHCGWMADCRACDSHLTVHRSSGRLVCHHCGLMQWIPTQCGQCHAHELMPIGVGTQRVYDYLAAQFPGVHILRIDRDEVRRKQALHERLDQIHRGEAQLIIGTQMLAKGHHFPKLTLVVVVDADNGFYNQDFRAIERLGQLLTQVAGRAGRELDAGHVVIQTHVPQHPLLNVLVQQGYGVFAQSLLTLRQQAGLPPYAHLAVLRAQSKTQPRVLHFLQIIKEQLGHQGISLLGPAPAPLARKAHHHRMQLLIQSPTRQDRTLALNTMRDIIHDHQLEKGVEWSIDVDPMDLS